MLKHKHSIKVYGTGEASSNLSISAINTIRTMETNRAGMGLKETRNASTQLSTSKSNNIDVHLEKNTEYGAIVILGASNYGKQGANITDRRMDKGETTGNGVQASTTGNKSGIYELGYTDMDTSKYGNELVAGTSNTSTELVAWGVDTTASRYVNRYENDTIWKIGDAMNIGTWHASKSSYNYYTDFIITRGNYNSAGGVFSTMINKYDGYANNRGAVRPIVVCGEGF